MTEIEQLRKEVNELRERVAKAEALLLRGPVDLMRFGTAPQFLPPSPFNPFNPNVITYYLLATT